MSNTETQPSQQPDEAAFSNKYQDLAKLHAEASARDRYEVKISAQQRGLEAAQKDGNASRAEMKHEDIVDLTARADRAGDAAGRSYDAEQAYLQRATSGAVDEAEAAVRSRNLQAADTGEPVVGASESSATVT